MLAAAPVVVASVVVASVVAAALAAAALAAGALAAAAVGEERRSTSTLNGELRARLARIAAGVRESAASLEDDGIELEPRLEEAGAPEEERGPASR